MRTQITHSLQTKLLDKLSLFYRRDSYYRSVGLYHYGGPSPHDPATLFDLAWDLSLLLEDYGHGAGNAEMLTLAKELTIAPTVVNIDTAVSLLHRDVLNYGLATDDEMHEMLCEDLVEWLITREITDGPGQGL